MIAMTAQTRPVSTAPSDSREADELVVGEGVVLDVRPTPFALRAAGTIIDILASLLLYIGVVILIVTVAGGSLLDDALVQTLATAALILCLVIVPAVVETLSHGRSLGRWAVGARIVRDDGGAISFRHALIRAVVGFAENIMTVGGLAALAGLLTTRSKRFGDLLAGTYSQHERVPRSQPNAVPVPPRLSEWAATADVARLPDRLAARVAQFVRNGATLSPGARDALARELADEVLPFVAPVPDAHPAELLIAVAAVRRDREYAALTTAKERLDALEPLLTSVPDGFPRR